MRGRFISLEGVDGAGKSSHVAFIAERLEARGIAVELTREPGGTPLGEALRALLLSEDMHPDTELLLMYAARHEHVAKRILPALEAGRWVISDRFSDASFAYQCGGRGISAARLQALEAWTLQGLQPDLTLLFDVSPEVAAARRAGARGADRFERLDLAFFARVRAAYLTRAREQPERFRVVDSARELLAVRTDLAILIDAL
jgi:dTMP kinase